MAAACIGSAWTDGIQARLSDFSGTGGRRLVIAPEE
jgi:hypothetical protein